MWLILSIVKCFMFISSYGKGVSILANLFSFVNFELEWSFCTCFRHLNDKKRANSSNRLINKY